MRVVAGLLSSSFSDKHVLIGKRKSTAFDGHWEFPGGKVEDGEDDRTALARELDEELGIHVHVCCPIGKWKHHNPETRLDFKITLYRVYLRHGSSHPRPRDDHSALLFTELRSILLGAYDPATLSLLPLAQQALEYQHDR